MSDFNIEKFPTSPSARRMLSRVSPVYQRSYVAKWLFEVMGQEVDEMRRRFTELIEQRFPDTVTWGIEYLEHKYSIVPDDSLTLPERRARLKRKKRGGHPLSPWHFEQIIQDRFGIDIDVDETVEHGILHIRTNTNENIGDPKPLYREIIRIKPSHLMVCMDTNAKAEGVLYFGEAPSIHTTYEIRPAEISDARTNARQYIGAAVSTHTAYEVYPDTMQNAAIDSTLYAGGIGSIYKSIEVTQT